MRIVLIIRFVIRLTLLLFFVSPFMILLSDVERLSKELQSVQQSKDDVENLKVEFSQRLGGLERRLVSMTKERDELKKNISNSDQSALLKVKDEEISGLRMEGENLSKKQVSY